jgi:hypothetical protein
MAVSVTGCTNVNITRDNNVRSVEMQQWNKRIGRIYNGNDPCLEQCGTTDSIAFVGSTKPHCLLANVKIVN